MIDDVITTGARIKIIDNFTKEIGSEIVGAFVLIDKKGIDVIGEIPIRCLIRIVPIQHE
ncbi:MAG: hypothetical protein ACTSQY_03780 [Candidatus Odinarchaeia archaeon]